MTAVDTVVMIGNSDDKLGQAAWSQFATETFDIVAALATAVHGTWASTPLGPWQNAAMSVTVPAERLDELRARLRSLAGEFSQDSIALLTGTTEFVAP